MSRQIVSVPSFSVKPGETLWVGAAVRIDYEHHSHALTCVLVGAADRHTAEEKTRERAIETLPDRGMLSVSVTSFVVTMDEA